MRTYARLSPKQTILMSLFLIFVMTIVGCAAAQATPTPVPAKPTATAVSVAPAAAPAVAPTATPAPAKPTPTPCAKLDKVSFRTDVPWDINHAAWLTALDKGWYKDACVDAEILEGQTGQTISLVGTGKADLGQMESTLVIQGVGQGTPLKMVAILQRKFGFGTIHLKQAGINKPKDLEGKKVGWVAGSSANAYFDAVMKMQGVDESKIEKPTVTVQNRDALMLEGKIDAYISVPFVRCPAIESQTGKPCNGLLFADYGVTIMGQGIAVNTDSLKAKPDAIKRFVQVSMRAWEYCKDNLPECVTSLDKRREKPPTTPDVTAKIIKTMYDDLGFTPRTVGKPYGYMDPQDWQETVDAAKKYLNLEVKSPDTYYTNELVPTKQ